MPLTTEGSPLVGGSQSKGAAPATQKVRVLRAFLLKTEPQKVGSEPVLDRRLALELRSLNKVEFVTESAKAKKE